MGLKTSEEKIGLVMGILIVIGSMLPRATGPESSVSGLEGSSVITLFLGIISIILVAIASWDRKNRIGQPIIGIFVIIIAGINVIGIPDMLLSSPWLGLLVFPWLVGIYLTIFGGIILVLLPLTEDMFTENRSDSADSTPIDWDNTDWDKAKEESSKPADVKENNKEGLETLSDSEETQ